MYILHLALKIKYKSPGERPLVHWVDDYIRSIRQVTGKGSHTCLLHSPHVTVQWTRASSTPMPHNTSLLCPYMVTWHVRIPGRITMELSVHHWDHQVTEWDLEGAHVPPGWGALMLMYSRLTSASTQPGGTAKDRMLWRHIVDTGI